MRKLFEKRQWALWSVFLIGFAVAPARAEDHAVGQQVNVKGVVVERNGDTFLLQNLQGTETEVKIASSTKVEERKSNIFRSGVAYSAEDIVTGLRVEVKGNWVESGAIEAREIKFTQDDLKVAKVVDSRLTPVESRLTSVEGTAGQLSGQVEELGIVSQQNRADIKDARQKAEQAMMNGDAAHRRIDETEKEIGALDQRITDLADYEVKDTVVALFDAGSSKLSPEAMESLDSLAEQVHEIRGSLLEVTGYASADGNEEFNRKLSEKRANAVMQYLAENQSIPLRFFVTPHGFGENVPVADNKTRDGRTQNRRVEVRLLVNRGIDNQAKTDAPLTQTASSDSGVQQ